MINRPGMTLIEVVVALAVSGLALASGAGALALLADRSAIAETRAASSIEQTVVRQTLIEWLTQARVGGAQGAPSFEGIDAEYQGRPDDALMFVTSAPTPLNTRETVVLLYIDRDESTPEQGLIAALMPELVVRPTTGSIARPSTTTASTRIERMELEPRAVALDIQYRSGLLGVDNWLPSWISTSVPPTAIELRLESEANDELPPLLRLPVRVSVRGSR
jgi:prepilin-type N-terminal cleavage/methylation domain-containing protein